MPSTLVTNKDRILRMPVEVKPSHPQHRRSVRASHDGGVYALPSVGGITYNLRIGDPALGWAGDHIEPCVSTKNPDDGKNSGANFLSCVGNIAKVKIGDDVRKGFVTGTHGGIEHVMIDFPQDVLEELTYDDTIRIETVGQGLAIEGVQDLKVMNLDPRMLELESWPIGIDGDALTVPVAKTLPARIMGAGLGADDCHSGDYDIQLFDPVTNEEFGLDDLRLGDIVAIIDADHSYGRKFLTGAVSVGVVVHGACHTAGHGPGVATLFASTSGKIRPQVTDSANLANILGAGVEPG
jgi:hypothetical protein